MQGKNIDHGTARNRADDKLKTGRLKCVGRDCGEVFGPAGRERIDGDEWFGLQGTAKKTVAPGVKRAQLIRACPDTKGATGMQEDSTASVFVGIDYHQKSVQVCVLDDAGQVLLNRSLANSREVIDGGRTGWQAASGGA
jgi:hypothetical protein